MTPATIALLFVAALLPLPACTQLSGSYVTACGSSCDHGSIRDPGSCCRSWGFEGGRCADLVRRGNVWQPGIAYCWGGNVMSRLAACLNPNNNARGCWFTVNLTSTDYSARERQFVAEITFS